MKKSLIAIAALGIVSGSAFADTQSADVNFDISVLSSCTFDNLTGATKTATGVAGTSSINLGTHDLKATCSLAMPYKLYVDSNTITLDNSTSPDANGEQLKVTAYVDAIGGQLVPAGSTNPDAAKIGSGAEQTETIAFEVTRVGGGRFVNKHVNETGKMTFTFEYVPQ